MEMKRSIVTQCIVAGVLVLSMIAGALVPAAPAHGTLGHAGITPAQTIPAPRYQVIADLATMESDIAQLKRDLSDARNEIRVLRLLRAYDIQMHQRTRAEDQKRIIALEWVLQGQRWPMCKTLTGDK